MKKYLTFLTFYITFVTRKVTKMLNLTFVIKFSDKIRKLLVAKPIKFDLTGLKKFNKNF